MILRGEKDAFEGCEDWTGLKSIHLSFQLERRLEALGMTRQTAISVLNRKGKGILIIKLRGTRFALGYNITKNITVEEGDVHE